jgi:pimeloyl-ACP methyl ester carboxylesterase
MRRILATGLGLIGLFYTVWLSGAPGGAKADDVLTIDHYVAVKSTVPSIAGQIAQLYVRQRVKSDAASSSGNSNGRAVVFVHGAGTPAEVSFDVAYQDYSWMAFLANAGFNVFSMDTTDYGRSTRPLEMNNPCNLSATQQAQFLSSILKAQCTPSYPHQLTTVASDWNDIDAVVNFVRDLLHVDKVSLVGWSLGGPRAGGYAATHPDKVEKLVLLAPAYGRNSTAEEPAKIPVAGTAMNTQTEKEFIANWDRQVGCSAQYDHAVAERVWKEMLESDPVGATWGEGVRRAPSTTTWGWNASVAGKMGIPTLMVSGAHDKQVSPDAVRNLYADLGTQQKVFIDLACSSHMAMWEKNHLLLFRASLEWLTSGTVNGTKQGMLRLGY